VAVHLAILPSQLREQRYSCHGCGNCCRDFTVQLREDDLTRLRSHDWKAVLGFDPVVEFRGTHYLRQRDDGSCVFWMEDGRCRIHAEHGLEAKPIACQMFPFSLTPALGGVAMGVNFACQSVLENKGADLREHLADLKRMARSLPEVRELERPPMLTRSLRASEREVRALTDRIDAWLRRSAVDLSTRLDGLAWVVQSLGAAKLEGVRDGRFADLLDALFGALPEELSHHPIAPPSYGQRRLLRQAVFARTEDPKIGRVERSGRVRYSLGQFLRSRRFISGRGLAPTIGSDWPSGVRLESVERVTPASSPAEIVAIDDLITRYLRATVLGGRAWGAGFYGWPIVDGLKAMVLNVAATGWLARLHTAARGRPSLDVFAVRAALSRIDRASGRAKWLGSRAETLRLAYLARDDGLRRALEATRFVNGVESPSVDQP
jgi:lysine-N-methylase